MAFLKNGSNASMVDVKDGKIIRIRPMHYDWKYDPEKHMNPWKMEVRGSTFEPSMKTLIPPYSIAYKKRVYSPARIRYPMKRVDWDPERRPRLHRPGRPEHPEPRQEQVRAHLLGRGARHHRRRDEPYQRDVWTDRSSLPVRPARRE